MTMKTEELFAIWDRFDRSDCTELTFESGDDKVVLSRKTAGPAADTGNAGISVRDRQTAAPAGTALADAQDSAKENSVPVRAPFVGTFYRAPAPGEEPFVKVGQTVKKGDTLAIIEAMKLMNEITSPCDGVVKEILAEDETMVEYDQALLRIEESVSA